MSKFRDETNIETYKSACPICQSDVKGNDAYKYFCSKCNILFRKEDLVITKEGIDSMVKEKIAEKFSKDTDALKIEDEPIKGSELTEKQQEVLKEHKAKKESKKPAKKKSGKIKSKSKVK